MIQRFYNTYAILERYTLTTDDYGEQIKTWSVSTTIHGVKQGRTGSASIVFDVEKIRTNERFYCDYVNLTANDRLLFSTKSYSFIGNSSASSMLSTSPDIGYLYFCNNTFSTYITGDYIRYGSTGYQIENFKYYKILFADNKEDIHLQIDIEEDNKNRI